ncbi:MAG TPA: helix-turn-helix transcriptional regulator, partial [Iamia sp.]
PLEGARDAALRTVVEASADDDVTAVTAAAEALEAMGCLLDAAEAFAFVARAHRRSGRTRPAARAAARSGALAGRCPGVATPALAERRSTTVVSARELQVARLAASGMTNRAIAQHLVVSERTVENHLYRAFTKLGVGSREELAAALPPEG